jgi:hypothetical protein
LGTIDAILTANIGKVMKLGIKDGDAVVAKQVTGKLVSALGQVVVVETSTGTLVFSKAQITSVLLTPGQGKLITSVTNKFARNALKFRVTGAPGKIVMISLERGLTWAPGYAVDITDKQKLSITAKATVINDLGDLNNIEARFITGFPHVPYATFLDPLVSGQDVNAFVNMVGAIGGAGGAMGPGGMASNRAGDMLRQSAGAPAPDLNQFVNAMPGNPLFGEQRQDLFFYRQPGVSLKTGERAYYVLFQAEAPYEEIYSWDVSERSAGGADFNASARQSQPEDVWHALQFLNTSGQPFTTGAATTFEGHEIVGQDLMKYVPNGGMAELRINKSLDVRAEAEEEEIARERGAIKSQTGTHLYDLVTVRGTLAVTSGKPDKVKMRIKKTLIGEVIAADGSTNVAKTTLGLRQMNPVSEITWVFDVQPRESQKKVFTYKLYVASRD